MGPFLFCQSCNRILLAQHKSTHMHMSVQGISCSTRAHPRATCHIGGLCRTEHTLGLCSCPVHCCLTRVCHQPTSSGVASMLLRTCPVLGTTDGLQDRPQDACPMHDSHRRETGRYKVPLPPQPSHRLPLSPSPSTSQCGFFHRKSPSSSFPASYHRAHLAVQPSAMEVGGPGTVG